MSSQVSPNQLADFWTQRVAPNLFGPLKLILIDPNRVEDVLAYTFWEVWQAYERGSIRFMCQVTDVCHLELIVTPLISYSKSIARHESFRQLENNRRCSSLSEANDIADHATPLDQLVRRDEEQERIVRCREVLNAISSRHRTVLLLSLEFSNYVDMSAALNVDVTTLKPLLHRARSSFRKAWKKMYDTPLESQELDHAR